MDGRMNIWKFKEEKKTREHGVKRCPRDVKASDVHYKNNSNLVWKSNSTATDQHGASVLSIGKLSEAKAKQRQYSDLKYYEDLRQQIEENRQKRVKERERIRIEEEKAEKRFVEQRARILQEYEEEQRKQRETIEERAHILQEYERQRKQREKIEQRAHFLQEYERQRKQRERIEQRAHILQEYKERQKKQRERIEDSEIQFGSMCPDEADGQGFTLPQNRHDFNSNQHSTLNATSVSTNSPVGSAERELYHVEISRANIVHDVINAFLDPKVLNVQLIVTLQNENALDSGGVSREVYSAFWEQFLEQCEGEDERVPSLRPDYSEKEWQAIGRVWLKGYLDHKLIPVRLSPAFVLACCQGVSSVEEELLMMSFIRFLSGAERASVEKALQGNVDENDEENLLDLFSRMGSHCLPSQGNFRANILKMAHKALLQQPNFIIDCFHTAIHNAVATLITKDNILELYESKRPTNKKVTQMIKPSTDYLNSQEQQAFNYLKWYVRSTDQRKLETFLRFCTGSNVLCKDTIAVTFNGLCGLSRRPVAHTCGAVLELPCTYNSYSEFCVEFDNILSGDCFAMGFC